VNFSQFLDATHILTLELRRSGWRYRPR